MAPSAPWGVPEGRCAIAVVVWAAHHPHLWRWRDDGPSWELVPDGTDPAPDGAQWCDGQCDGQAEGGDA